jgi:6-phosphogluconolactonase/glucosamine-6-phosphate isomerase/deaminase
MSQFKFSPSPIIPFRDTKAIERVIRIKREDFTKHKNPKLTIEIMPDAEVEFRWMADMFHRIKEASDHDRPLVIITPNPAPVYKSVAYLINKFKVNCRKLHTFNMDEYANELGETAPEDWPQGFAHQFKKFFFHSIDPKLRPLEKNVLGPTHKNIKDYGKMIADLGNADVCYSGPGWTGHLAFIEPDAPEFASKNLKEWLTFGPRICTLSPFTLAQNSLHGSFGMAGNLCAVPPKAATIGPAEVIRSKVRFELHALTIDGSFASWQRIMTRLALHGPVTPRVPTSLHQLLETTWWIGESNVADIKPYWNKAY